MTDRDLATALAVTSGIEMQARASYERAVVQRAEAEKDVSLAAMRHVIALRRSLEKWIADRSVRALTASLPS